MGTLWKSVLVHNFFFLAITKGSYGAFCPFTFLGESQKISSNVDGQMIQTKNENQRLKDEVVGKVSKNEDVQKGPKKITLEKLKAPSSLKKSSKKN